MMIAETERLLLRRFRMEDAQDLYEYLSQPETVRYEPYDVFSPSHARQEAAARARSEDFIAVCLKDTGKLIGNLYLHEEDYGCGEMGFVFNARYLHRGYATEAARALLRVAFAERRMHRVIALCNPENTPSWRLMERLGMRREGHLRKNIYFRRDASGEPLWQDTYEYAILREEWQPTAEI